jgi:pimeloyl-ACP methyl ester carboxylesterase
MRAGPGWGPPPGTGRISGDGGGDTKRVLAAVLAASLVVGVASVSLIAGGGRPGGPYRSDADCSLDLTWQCTTVEVPRLRSGPGAPAAGSIDVLSGVHPASEPASGAGRRVLVLVVGGPGASGVDDADWMLSALDPRITRAFDVVAFDARGTGGTDVHACPNAGTGYAASPVSAASARAFAEACTAETGLSDDELAGFSSASIAEDIDAIRAALGAERITLYGSSYGTVIAQAYAAAHADRLDGLVLDAPIDRAVPAARLWLQAATGFQTALEQTFTACGKDVDCHEGLPDPRRTLAILDEELGSDDRISARVTGPDGSSTSEVMTRDDFQSLTEASMYEELGRMSLLRALAAFSATGDRTHLLRLVDVMGSPRHAASFTYFATWCSDVRASPSARTDDFEAFALVARQSTLALEYRETAWTLAPCLYWPGQAATWSPPPESTTVPTLILASTGDPITPVEEARSILARHAEARLVETQGGAHGSLGDACPGDRMADFVVSGRLPVGASSICQGTVIGTYVPVAPSPADTPDDAALGVLWELLGAPEVAAWDGVEPLSLGCTRGGTAALVMPDGGDRVNVTLRDCAWAVGAEVDGSGWFDLYTWDADLDLRSSSGSLRLVTRGETWTLTGTWAGRKVDIRD